MISTTASNMIGPDSRPDVMSMSGAAMGSMSFSLSARS